MIAIWLNIVAYAVGDVVFSGNCFFGRHILDYHGIRGGHLCFEIALGNTTVRINGSVQRKSVMSEHSVSSSHFPSS